MQNSTCSLKRPCRGMEICLTPPTMVARMHGFKCAKVRHRMTSIHTRKVMLKGLKVLVFKSKQDMFPRISEVYFVMMHHNRVNLPPSTLREVTARRSRAKASQPVQITNSAMPNLAQVKSILMFPRLRAALVIPPTSWILVLATQTT